MTTAAKYIEKLPEEWQATFLEMYNEGASDVEIMKQYALSPIAWKTMLNDITNSDFREIVEFGNVLAEAWWMALGRANVDNKQFNTQLYNITMQNRFGWSQKAETKDDNPLALADKESLDRRINELLEGRSKRS